MSLMGGKVGASLVLPRIVVSNRFPNDIGTKAVAGAAAARNIARKTMLRIFRVGRDEIVANIIVPVEYIFRVRLSAIKFFIQRHTVS